MPNYSHAHPLRSASSSPRGTTAATWPGPSGPFSIRRWRDLEVLVIDDGSTDDTPAVVRPFLSDPRVRYHRTDGLGQSRAKNLGILHSRGAARRLPRRRRRMAADEARTPAPALRRPGRRRRLRPADADGRRAAATCRSPAAVLLAAGCTTICSFRTPSASPRSSCDGRCSNAVGHVRPEPCRWRSTTTCGCASPGTTQFDFVDEPLVRYRTGHANLSSRITERITSVLSVLRRSLVRWRNAETSSVAAQAEAWGSTCRTMGFVFERATRFAAARWYLRAAQFDGRWGASAKAVMGGLLRCGPVRSG